MKRAKPTVAMAVRTAKGERQRIRSFLRQVEGLGVQIDDLPPASLRALGEAEKFLGRYLDLLARETPTREQLEGVLEALGGIDRVVKRSMAEILKSLGWRPEQPPPGQPAAEPVPPPKAKSRRSSRGSSEPSAKIIQFPGPRSRRPPT